LGEDSGVPVLLFNPAMKYQSVQVNIPEINTYKCPLRLVVIGEKDDVINPVENKKFFAQNMRENIKQKVLSCSWLEHSIDLQTFDEMIFWAVKNYGIWKLLQLTNK
jgi:hypothetical protein